MEALVGRMRERDQREHRARRRLQRQLHLHRAPSRCSSPSGWRRSSSRRTCASAKRWPRARTPSSKPSSSRPEPAGGSRAEAGGIPSPLFGRDAVAARLEPADPQQHEPAGAGLANDIERDRDRRSSSSGASSTARTGAASPAVMRVPRHATAAPSSPRSGSDDRARGARGPAHAAHRGTP